MTLQMVKHEMHIWTLLSVATIVNNVQKVDMAVERIIEVQFFNIKIQNLWDIGSGIIFFNTSKLCIHVLLIILFTH